MKVILKKAVIVYDVFYNPGTCVHAEDNWAKYALGLGDAAMADEDDEAVNTVPVAPEKPAKKTTHVVSAPTLPPAPVKA
jgi:hypothetical protein